MKILFCSSEAFPFSKTGGLADMVIFYQILIKALGHDIVVITPSMKVLKNTMKQ